MKRNALGESRLSVSEWSIAQGAGTSLAKLAFQFSTQNSAIPTTMFSTANRECLRRNLEWHAEP